VSTTGRGTFVPLVFQPGVNAGVIFPKSAGVKFPTLAVSVVSR
jgi:hypothetical protein